jgi:hypothetical protein
VKAIATEHLSYLQAAQLRLRYFDSCPAIAVWVCFWHDVWHSNQDMQLLTEEDEVKRALNPWDPSSLSWNVENSDNVNARLQAAGLQSKSGKGFIGAHVVQKLFDDMAHATEHPPAGSTAVYADGRTSGNVYEVMQHPAYEALLAPLLTTEQAAPGFEWLRKMCGHAHDDDFYDAAANRMVPHFL